MSGDIHRLYVHVRHDGIRGEHRDDRQNHSKQLSHSLRLRVEISDALPSGTDCDGPRLSLLLRAARNQYGLALKTKLTVLVSDPAMVTSIDWSPYDSCHAVTVYFPGGKFGRVKPPSALEMAKWEFFITANWPDIQG